MNETTAAQRILKSLLSFVVSEWGYDAVRRCLSELEGTSPEHLERDHPDGGRQGQTPIKPRGGHRRPTAIDLVNRIEVPEPKKSLLTTLASQFERKAFLPTVSDVRHFLEMRGQQATIIKQRQDAFGKILESLLNMPDDELTQFVQSNSHSGPSQLGPLSEAIKATSAAIRSSEAPASISWVDEECHTPQEELSGSTESSSNTLAQRPTQ